MKNLKPYAIKAILLCVSLGSLAGCSALRQEDVSKVNETPHLVDITIPNTPVGKLIIQVAEKEGVPVLVFNRLIKKESHYNIYAVGQDVEIGLGQIKLATAKGEGYQGTAIGLFEAETNLTYSARYLKRATRGNYYDCRYLALYQLGAYAKPRCTAYGNSLTSTP